MRPSAPVYRFDRFVVDVANSELTSNGQVIPVQAKVFELIRFLARAQGRICSSTELLNELWSDQVIGRTALPQAIRSARQALGDDGKSQRLIKTVRDRGYRLCNVEPEGPAASVTRPEYAQSAEKIGAVAAMVGRSRELALLCRAADESMEDSGRVVLIAGEPGIGKTRLAEAVAEYSREKGVRVYVGRCLESEGAPAFWPWAELARTHIAQSHRESLIQGFGSDERDIASVMDDFRAYLLDLDDAPTLEPDQARLRFLDSAANLLRRAAKREPLVLILEDLHGADLPSLELLRLVARDLRRIPILIVATYRDAAIDSTHPFRRARSEIRREPCTTEVQLRGLDVATISELVLERTGVTAPASFVRRLTLETGGNPFFVGEILQYLIEEGWVVPSEGRWSRGGKLGEFPLPDGVCAVIEQRLRRLGGETGEILGDASVIGNSFSLVSLASMRQTDPESVQRALDQALDACLLIPAKSGLGHYEFAHALIRETLYQNLSASDRRERHLRVGEFLLARPIDGLGSGSEEVAHHLLAAAPFGDLARTIALAVESAEKARARFAPEVSCSFYEKAIDVLDLLEAEPGPKHCELQLALGEARLEAGELEASMRTIDAAGNLALSLGNRDLLLRAALCGGLRPARPLEFGGLSRERIELIKRALEVLDDQELEVRAQLTGRLALAAHWAGSPARAESLAKQAIEIARRRDDPYTLVYVLRAEYAIAMNTESSEDRLLRSAQLVETASRCGDDELDLLCRTLYLSDLSEGMTSIVEFQAEIERYRHLNSRLRQPAARWWWSVYESMIALMVGNFSEAERRIEASLALGRDTHMPAADLLCRNQRWQLRRYQGRVSEELASMRELARDHVEFPAMTAAHALALLEAGYREEARTIYRRLLLYPGVKPHDDHAWQQTLALLAELASRLDETEAADELEASFEHCDSEHIVVGFAGAYYGPVSYFRGLLSALQGDWLRAEERLELSIHQCERLGARPWMARAQLDLARVLAKHPSSGKAAHARALMRRAQQTSRALGFSLSVFGGC